VPRSDNSSTTQSRTVAGLDCGRSERVSYREAGAAQRAATARANQLADRPTAADRCVLDAVFSLTTTYSKLTEFVFVAQVADLAGVHRVTAGESIRKLAAGGVIVWVPGRGRRSRSLIGVHDATREKEAAAASFSENGKGSREEPEKEVTVTSPSRREQENEKKALVKTAAGRALGASLARSRAKARCGADAPLPAEGFELEDEQEQSSWVTGETPSVAHLVAASSADRQSAATTVAELERDDDRQVDGDAGYSEPAVGAGHGDVPNRDAGPAPVPPKLQAALPARLNADVVRLAAKHFETAPLAVLAIAGRATTADDPPGYFASALRGSIQGDELADRQAQLQHEATGQEPRKAITGARWVRGETGATYLRDPLGTDKPPPDYGWPYPPPTPEEILEARKASQQATDRDH